MSNITLFFINAERESRIAITTTAPKKAETTSAQKADFWLIKYNQAKDKTYSELKSDYEPYTRFEAYKKRCVYGCNTGRILFYENTPFHPERLLKDLISVFYPEKLEGYVPVYFSKLAE